VTISSLRHEMEKAVSRADLMTARELAAKQLISELQREVDNLRSRLAAEQPRTTVLAAATAPLEARSASVLRPIPTPPAVPSMGDDLNTPFEEWKKAKRIPRAR